MTCSFVREHNDVFHIERCSSRIVYASSRVLMADSLMSLSRAYRRHLRLYIAISSTHHISSGTCPYSAQKQNLT